MSRLGDVLESNREVLVQRFSDRLYETTASKSLDRGTLIDSLREFLDEIILGLRREQHSEDHDPSAVRSEAASEHGRQRFGVGYDVGGMVREYAALRDVLFQVLEESGRPFSIRELRVLTKYLISGIADAATTHAALRDEQMREQSSRHLGFLAHELRNPLSSMKLAYQTMRKRGDVKSSRSAQILERGMGTIGELIDNALIEVRLKSRADVDAQEIALGDFLETLADELTGEVEGKDLMLAVEAEKDLRLRGDKKILRSAVSNLLRNAVKFTVEKGRVSIRAKSSGRFVIIEVEDECGGLAEGQVTKLFDPFVQSGKDRSGFGLGLAIAKQAVEAHQGVLRLHNLPGKGCVFLMELPTEGPTKDFQP